MMDGWMMYHPLALVHRDDRGGYLSGRPHSQPDRILAAVVYRDVHPSDQSDRALDLGLH